MEEKQSQELDMFELMIRCKEVASRCYCIACSFFTNILRLTYGYKFLFLTSLIAAGALAYYKTSGDRRIYRGEMALKINAGTSYTIADMMNELDNFVYLNDSKALAEALKISEEEAMQVAHVKSFFYIAINRDSTRAIIDYNGRYDIEDTLNIRVKDKLVISVGLKDRDMFEKMQNTITSYINRNEYLNLLHAKHIENLRQRENVINCDLSRIDSLQDQQFFKETKPEIYLFNKTQLRTGQQDLFYNDKQNLLDKKQTLEEQLAGNNTIVTIMSPFHPTAVSSVSFLKKFLIYGFVFYILFLICATVYKNRAKIHEYLKEK